MVDRTSSLEDAWGEHMSNLGRAVREVELTVCACARQKLVGSVVKLLGKLCVCEITDNGTVVLVS